MKPPETYVTPWAAALLTEQGIATLKEAKRSGVIDWFHAACTRRAGPVQLVLGRGLRRVAGAVGSGDDVVLRALREVPRG